MMEEHQWNPEELQALALLGLAITPHADAALGWGYTWQGSDWSGPFLTPDAAIHAAFGEAQQALQFRSDYSWVVSVQPGERWQFNGKVWVQIEGSQKKGPRDIEASNVEEQARQDWSNDE
jgi:hypothetical protein